MWFYAAPCLPFKCTRPSPARSRINSANGYAMGVCFCDLLCLGALNCVRTADSSFFSFGLSLLQHRPTAVSEPNWFQSGGPWAWPRLGMNCLKQVVNSRSYEPEPALPRRPLALPSRRRLSSSEGDGSVCGFPLGPASGLLYLSLAWVNRSSPERRWEWKCSPSYGDRSYKRVTPV